MYTRKYNILVASKKLAVSLLASCLIAFQKLVRLVVTTDTNEESDEEGNKIFAEDADGNIIEFDGDKTRIISSKSD